MRFKRERIARWQDRRVDAYADYGASLKRTMSTLYRVAAGRDLDDQTEPMTLDEAMPQLAAAFHDREVAFEVVMLVGSTEIQKLAREWTTKVYAMRNAVGDGDTSRSDWKMLVGAANASRAEYYACATRDVGRAVESDSRK